jgi:hypothetical protein
MAIMKNPEDREYRGRINDKYVIRQYTDFGRTVLSMYPDMSKIEPSVDQKLQRLNFKEAQTLALQILLDPEVKAFYKDLCKPGQRPHNVLIAELLKKDTLIEANTRKKIFVVSRKPRKGA